MDTNAMELTRSSFHHGDNVLFTESQLVNKYGSTVEKQNYTELIRRKLRSIRCCSGENAKSFIRRTIPIVQWLPEYKVRENVIGDILAGLTVGVVHLPQGLAYALLASLPPVVGLYVSFFPVLIYMILGTSRHMSIGTFAVVSLMIAQVITDNVPACEISEPTAFSRNLSTTTSYNVTSEAEIDCEQARVIRKIEIAVALAMANGIIQILMFLLRLGVVTTYLSRSLVSGFTCAAAFHVFTSQVPKLLGVNITRSSGALALIYAYGAIFKVISTVGVNWATVIVSICCITFLATGKFINSKLHDRLPLPIPWELGVVILATLVSFFAKLQGVYKVAIVGNIPTGIKVSVPDISDIGSIFFAALPIAIVAFATEISLSQIFAAKHSYVVVPDQELLAMGFGNVVGSFFQCFPCAPSLSRSVICDEAGAKTQLNGLFSSALILTILLWIGPLFESLPQAALASIICVNLKNLLKQFVKIPSLWRISKLDALVWIVTWVSVVFLGVSLGLVVAVVFQVFSVVIRIQRAEASALASVGNSSLYRDVKRYRTDRKSTPGVIVLQFPAPIIFANQSRFNRQIFDAIGIDPFVAKEQSPEDRLSNSPESCNQRLDHYGSTKVKDCDRECNQIQHSHSTDDIIDGGGDEDNIPLSNNVGSVENGYCVTHHVILDLSFCPFIDNDGANTLNELHRSLERQDIHLFVSGCNANVLHTLQAFCQNHLPPIFLDVPKAVEVATGRYSANFDERGDIVEVESSSRRTSL